MSSYYVHGYLKLDMSSATVLLVANFMNIKRSLFCESSNCYYVRGSYTMKRITCTCRFYDTKHKELTLTAIVHATYPGFSL